MARGRRPRRLRLGHGVGGAHAPLLAATTPPTGRYVLVNGLDAFVETRSGRYALTSQRYPDGVVHPDGASRIEFFTTEPWPRWTYRLEERRRRRGSTCGRSCRDGTTTAPNHENADLSFGAEVAGEGARVAWRP